MEQIAAGIDIGQIVDLTSQVATTGALRLAEMVSDQMYEFTIGIVVIVQGTCGN